MSGQPNAPRVPPLVVEVEARDRPRVEIIPHALERMRQRGIATDEVIDALRNPDEEGLPADPPRLRVRRLLQGAALDVIFEELPDRIRVITTMIVGRRLSGRF